MRHPTPEDGAAMQRLAVEAGLDRNSPYAYLMCAHYFGETSLVAVDRAGGGERLAGFITGFRPPRSSDTLFVWQIAVAESHRGQGIAGRMLRSLLQRNAGNGVRYLEASIAPGNVASQRAFHGVARDLETRCEESLLFDAGLFEDAGDIETANGHDAREEQAHEPELLFRIGPFDPARLTSATPAPAGRDPATGTEG